MSSQHAMSPFPPQPPHTLLIGSDDLPFVTVDKGVELQLLHVDLSTGLWINRTRLQPGASVIRHLHTGPVFAVTLQGRWYYRESPEQVNEPGSYLFEPAGSIHTLQSVADQAGPTVAWFAIWGPNINLRSSGEVHSISDARSVLAAYQELCAEADLDSSRLIIAGK